MRLVHLSDLHLGFRQYQRLTSGGINQREADVAQAFRRAIDRVIALAPDVVVMAGDIFHSVRPTNPAIVDAFQQFARLKHALPDADIVMVAGNHDTPRASETGCILRLFSPLGIHVVVGEEKRLEFPRRELSILAVPDLLGQRPTLAPDPNARFNVLVLHGEVEGMMPAHISAADRAGIEITAAELGAHRWNYVALGHYHVYRRIAPNAYYSGAIEYASPNPWGELIEERSGRIPGKGIIEHDLETGAHRFHPLPASRALIDLPPLSARGLTATEIDDAIRERIDAVDGGIEDQVVRLVVRDIPRHVVRDLDHRAIREYRRRAMHFHLDARRPEPIRLHAHGAPGRRPSLADTVREQLSSRPLDPSIDRPALIELGLHYLKQAEAATITIAAPLEDA